MEIPGKYLIWKQEKKVCEWYLSVTQTMLHHVYNLEVNKLFWLVLKVIRSLMLETGEKLVR